jgi:hypothetical protein
MKYSKALAATAVMIVLGAGTATAQRGEIGIYKGDLASQKLFQLGAWGSGVAAETGDFVYTGGKSIKITTHGRYQGARFILTNPVDLKAAVADPTSYLQFVMIFPDPATTGGSGLGSGSLGSGTGRGGGGLAGAAGGEGALGGGGAGTRTIKPRPLANVRLLLIMSDGKRSEMAMEIASARREREEWKSLAIPVGSIPGIKESNGMLKEIQIFGDSPATLYLGEVRVVRDETPIRIDDLNEQTVAKNDTVTFVGSAEGGPSPLKYEWTIRGVASKDPTERSEVSPTFIVTGEGRTFKHQFRKGGDYEVSLTVSDVFGIKKPSTTKTNIHVTL